MSLVFGFQMPSFTFPDARGAALFDRVATNAKAAETAGFDLVTVMDHFYQVPRVGLETEPVLEAYTTLAAIAARTDRIKVGTLVTSVTHRNPALLAKVVTTLDIISKGRAILGIGAGWNETEHIAYGLALPSIGERMERLDEALSITRLMFTQERPSFVGRYYRIDGALNFPRPIQPGGPKILIGGTGATKTLRLLARHGDIGHWYGRSLEELRRTKGQFEGHCAAVGRDPSSVLLMMEMRVILADNEREGRRALDLIPAGESRDSVSIATPLQAAELLRPYVELGFGGFNFSNQMLRTTEAIGLAGDVIKLLRTSNPSVASV